MVSERFPEGGNPHCARPACPSHAVDQGVPGRRRTDQEPRPLEAHVSFCAEPDAFCYTDSIHLPPTGPR